MRGAWIEMLILRLNRPDGDGSLPVRGAWIEIKRGKECPVFYIVAPRAGSVD